jgi:hypothetical protein
MRLSVQVLASLLAVGSLSATSSRAATIPYQNVGQLAPASNFTATATGEVTAYFAGSSAGDNDTIALWDVSAGTMSSFILPNHSSTVNGIGIDMLSVNAGDTLVFILDNVSEGQFEDSLNNNETPTTWSNDGYNHAYATSYTGGISGLPNSLIGVGTYVGMEDLSYAVSDLDYNDDTFVFTNVGVSDPTPTPEPSSIALLGTGLLGAAGALRRKFAR